MFITIIRNIRLHSIYTIFPITQILCQYLCTKHIFSDYIHLHIYISYHSRLLRKEEREREKEKKCKKKKQI